MILNPFKYYSKKYKDRNLNSKQLAKMMNLWPPSIANRIKVVNVSKDFMKAKMIITQSWLNSAFDKIMFGGTSRSGGGGRSGSGSRGGGGRSGGGGRRR